MSVCKCGRDSSKVHCVRCGSFACYARRSCAQRLRLPDGTFVEDMNYTCRKCALSFFESNRLACAAPASNFTGKMRTLSGAIQVAPEVQNMTREQKMQWVREQLTKKGTS